MTLDIAHFTPGASLAGGLLIGLAAAILILGAGRIMGASGLYADLVSAPSLNWRWAWLAGLIVPALIARFGAGLGAPKFPSSVVTVAVAGLLVGFGTRLGSGCTSGHGVCGLARFSPRSLAATPIFMATAFLTVVFVRHVLV